MPAPSPALRQVALSLATDGTSFSDDAGGPVAITTSDGTITITDASVPEPSSLVLAGLGVTLILIASKARSSRSQSVSASGHQGKRRPDRRLTVL
jgi:PEP-CTERM motif